MNFHFSLSWLQPRLAHLFEPGSVRRLLGNPSEAGFVSFFDATRDFASKSSAFHARAVRGP